MTSSTFRRIAGVLFVCLALGAAYLAGLVTRPAIQAVSAADHQTAALIDEAWQLVDDQFYGALPSQSTRAYAAIRGLLSSLNDSYTVLIEPPAAKLESDQLRGRFGGIGAELRRDADGRTRISPYPNGPAARAGVAEGDELIAVDGARVTPTQRLDEIEARLRGDVGSRVRLGLRRDGQVLDLEVERAQMAPPSVVWRMIDAAPGIGYISIRSFTDRTSGEVRQAIAALRAQDARALVIDVRDNGGGLLQAAVDTTGHFVEGPILIEQQRGGGERPYHAASGGAAVDLPLAVLINHSTASASEILAGSLHDRGRAILIGEPTFGKGSVQSVFPLADGSALHITTAVWLTPSRQSLSGQSLQPDIEVKRTAEDVAAGRDPVLDRAAAYLQSQP